MGGKALGGWALALTVGRWGCQENKSISLKPFWFCLQGLERPGRPWTERPGKAWEEGDFKKTNLFHEVFSLAPLAYYSIAQLSEGVLQRLCEALGRGSQEEAVGGWALEEALGGFGRRGDFKKTNQVH